MEDLDSFLKEDALKQQDKNLNITYLAIYEKTIIGYVSILADKVECKKISKNKGEYDYYPAVKIGRLAVDERYKRIGLRNDILDTMCIYIKRMSKLIPLNY